MKPKVMIHYGHGINCDNETARAFEDAGARTEKVLMSQLESGEKNMLDYGMPVFPGGFSYGDDIAAGRVMGIVEFKYKLKDQMQALVDKKRPILGICNGFQIMVNMGLLPGLASGKGRDVTLITNDSGMFEDRWVHLDIDKDSPCIFTRNIERLYLPVRHGEGKFYAKDHILTEMKHRKTIVARYTGPEGQSNPKYPWNPNGSLDSIAAICDPTGLMFGLMPHPEGCAQVHHHPRWTRDREAAEYAAECSRRVFSNAVNYLK